MDRVDSRAAYKDLVVWQKSMEFANQVIDVTELLDSQRKHYQLVEQLVAATTSVLMIIVEGKGRFSHNEIDGRKFRKNPEYLMFVNYQEC
jgi:hypothetical protein